VPQRAALRNEKTSMNRITYRRRRRLRGGVGFGCLTCRDLSLEGTIGFERSNRFARGLLLVVALAACNGTPRPRHDPTPAPVIVPTPTVGRQHVCLFRFADADEHVRVPATVAASSTVNTAAVTENVVVSTSPAPPPLSAPASALDYNASETDAYGLQSVVTTTDSWQVRQRPDRPSIWFSMQPMS